MKKFLLMAIIIFFTGCLVEPTFEEFERSIFKIKPCPDTRFIGEWNYYWESPDPSDDSFQDETWTFYDSNICFRNWDWKICFSGNAFTAGNFNFYYEWEIEENEITITGLLYDESNDIYKFPNLIFKQSGVFTITETELTMINLTIQDNSWDFIKQ